MNMRVFLSINLLTVLPGCDLDNSTEPPSPNGATEQASAPSGAPPAAERGTPPPETVAPPVEESPPEVEEIAAPPTLRTVVRAWNSEPGGEIDRWEAMVCVDSDGNWAKTCEDGACSARCPSDAQTITMAAADAGAVTLHSGEGSFAMEDFATTRYERYFTTSEPAKEISTGKTISELGLPNAQYTKTVGEAVGQSDPGLTQLLKIDLDGDGVDEVLFAGSVGGVESLAPPEGDATAVPVWSYVGLRRVVGEEVKTVMLTEWSATSSYEDLRMGKPGTYVNSVIAGFTDANGDGTLEVVIESQGDHSVWTQVMKIDGERVQELGASD